MHELGICQDIIEIVTREIKTRNLEGIDELGLRIGILSGVDPDALRFAFESASRDSMLDGVTLAIDLLPIAGTCRSCGTFRTFAEYDISCSVCGGTEFSITQGDELEISYVIERGHEKNE